MAPCEPTDLEGKGLDGVDIHLGGDLDARRRARPLPLLQGTSRYFFFSSSPIRRMWVRFVPPT